MHVYLPIAELSVNIFIILGMGAGVGVLSGIFGVGGGFLMTPLLIFIGVPSAIAVGTEANQIIAASVSGVLAHWRRGNVDFKMGAVLLVGGLFGSRSEEHTSELQSLMRISYAVFCLKKTIINHTKNLI